MIPATNGADILVPESLAYLLLATDDKISWPGAAISGLILPSAVKPQLEKRLSLVPLAVGNTLGVALKVMVFLELSFNKRPSFRLIKAAGI